MQAAAADKPFKLSVGEYRYGGNFGGQDMNLRYRRGDSSVWLGAYRDRDFGNPGLRRHRHQLAAHRGLDTGPAAVTAMGVRRLLGGSFSVELGEPWFVQAGIGRTNTRPYFNLNFDPNDACPWPPVTGTSPAALSI